MPYKIFILRTAQVVVGNKVVIFKSDRTHHHDMLCCVCHKQTKNWFQPEFSRLKYMPCHLRKTSRQISINQRGQGVIFILEKTFFYQMSYFGFCQIWKYPLYLPPYQRREKRQKFNNFAHFFLICYMIVYICIKICARKADLKNILTHLLAAQQFYLEPTKKVKIRYQLQSLKLTFRIEINFKSTVQLHFI